MRSRSLTSRLARAHKKKLRPKSTPTFTQNVFTTPHQSWLDNNGEPLAGGLLYVYEAGTSTPIDTWQDAALTQKNTNPVILDAGGFATVWLDSTKAYKFRMTNSLGVQQWSIDDYVGGALTANILVPINYLLPATGWNDIDNGNNTQAWRWSLTGTAGEDGLFISESAVSTNTGLNSALVGIGTHIGSTIAPFRAIAHSGPGLMVNAAGDIVATNGANIISNITGINYQCVQADINGRLFGTGVPCGSGGGPGGGIASINGDMTPAQHIVGTGSVTVSTAGGVTTINVPLPAAPALSSITVSPTSVAGGNNSTGTVTLTIPAPSGGVVVSLSSSNAAVATVPASVTVLSATNTATFTVTTHAVGTNTPVTITGNYGATQSTTLTVNAPPPVQPIYGGVGQPGATSSVTLSGTNVTLSTGDVIGQLQTTPEAVGQSWAFSPNNQVVYLLLFGGSHTFTDANTGQPFVFNAPIAVSLSGVAMYLYQSTNPLYGPSKPKVQS